MLSKQSWRRAALGLVAAGLAAGGTFGPAYADPGDQGTPEPAAEAGENAGSDRPDADGDQGDEGDTTTPPRHTPVEVCHLHGNGTYALLRTDDSALEAHKRHGDLYPVPADGCPATAEDATDETEAGEETEQPGQPAQPGDPGHDDAAHGHTPVTVCHLLGNGGYHLLTFDDSALKAHQDHGDLYPVPAGGCPEEAAAAQPGPAAGPAAAGPAAGTVAGAQATGATSAAGPAEAAVLGVQKAAAGGPKADAQVAGQSATAAVSPVAAVLPQTGAGRFGLLLAAAGTLLAAGVTLLLRRRAAAAS